MSAEPIAITYPAETTPAAVLGPWTILPDEPTPLTTEAGEVMRTELGFKLERVVAAA